MNFPTYLVGGAVRDELMELPSKDLDYVMLAPSFEAMRAELLSQGCKIFVEKPEFLTIRAMHPSLGSVDFACGRKDGEYTDGRRPDSTAIAANIEEDLARRDFTCNAMAKNVETGRIIDPFGGRLSIATKLLSAVGDAEKRMNEDYLRAFRAIRFAVQKDFVIEYHLGLTLLRLNPDNFAAVSTERIRDELLKMFMANPERAFELLYHKYPILGRVVNARGIWFRPTMEGKK